MDFHVPSLACPKRSPVTQKGSHLELFAPIKDTSQPESQVAIEEFEDAAEEKALKFTSTLTRGTR